MACAFSFALGGCSVFGDTSFGVPSQGLKNEALVASYLPLKSHELVLVKHWGVAIVVAPHVAVTDAHNVNLILTDMVLAESKDYDLLFFRTERTTPAVIADAHAGEAIVAYGQGRSEELREASGVVHAVGMRVEPLCSSCAEQPAFTYDAEAGPGFSGGPVVDADTGAVVGLTFGFRTGQAANGGIRMFAYGMDLVLAEMHRLLGPEGPKS